jgi:hypothetical protein
LAWATHYITKLKLGEMVSFSPSGKLMQGKIESGQFCTVEPIDDYYTLEKGDIVLRISAFETAFKSATIVAESMAGLRRIQYSGNVLKLKIRG